MRHIALLSTLFGTILLTEPAAAERPNIVLMMVDDLGFSDFGC